VAQLGLNNGMSEATANWQQQIGDLALDTPTTDFQTQVEMILGALSRLDKPEEKI